jgi:ATP-dependent RNA helicase SUPV3L1/SUV3
LGRLEKGRNLISPVFKPVRAIGEFEGDALRDVTMRAEAWIAAQLEKHLGGIVALQALSQDAGVDGNVRALAVQLAEEGGIAGRVFLADAMAALPKEARGAARKGGIVFGALDVYHHAALKPAAAKWRAALFAARDAKPMQELPPESAVHLKDWHFKSISDCRNAGYRKIGDEYLRIDLAERVIKKAHEARGQGMTFGMDMAFVTSLGVSEAGLNALMRDAGFKKIDAPKIDAPDIDAPKNTASGVVAVDDAPAIVTDDGASELAADAETNEASKPPEPAESILTHWRWVGIRNVKPASSDRRPQQRAHGKPARNDDGKIQRKNAKPQLPRPQVANPKPETTAPSSLALQLAALQVLQSQKAK